MNQLNSSLTKELKAMFGTEKLQMADDPHALRTYSKDLWPRNLILAREKDLSLPAIDLVVWPDSVQTLSLFLRYAYEKEIELFPYGAGSGVCGAATVTGDKKRPRVVVDLKRLDRIEMVDSFSQIAKIQAGIMGQVCEEDLNQKGFTLGHFPSSIYCSSFGGYLATRAAGQLSTYYGKIEDMVLAIEGVLPSGEIFTTPLAPRMSVGPDWNHLLMGSEGSLAFLTAAWVKIHRLAQDRQFLSYVVESTPKALDGIRTWIQAGLRPAAVRLYDEDESKLLMGLKSGTKLVCVVEGDLELTQFTTTQMDKMAKNFAGFISTGEEPAQHWWAHRYDISYRQQQIMSHRRLILDTFEVATTWTDLPKLHQAVKSVVDRFSQNGEMFVLLAHFSHFYHCGGNIYFTLCGRANEQEPTESFYDRVWDALLDTCEKQGAAVSHHHGIGRLKAKAFANQRGVFHPLLKRLKDELDPKHLLNPENLGL